MGKYSESLKELSAGMALDLLIEFEDWLKSISSEADSNEMLKKSKIPDEVYVDRFITTLLGSFMAGRGFRIEVNQ